jgi:hypothetical protein
VVEPGRGQRALVGHGEPAHLVHLVTEELHPDGVVLGGGKNVDDAAADSELTAVRHHVHPGVRRIRQPPHHVGKRNVLANLQRDRNQLAQAGHHRLDHGADRRHHHTERSRRRAFRVRQPAQHGESPAHGV